MAIFGKEMIPGSKIQFSKYVWNNFCTLYENLPCVFSTKGKVNNAWIHAAHSSKASRSRVEERRFLLLLLFTFSRISSPLKALSREHQEEKSQKPLSASQIALCSFLAGSDKVWEDERGLFWGGALRKKRLVFFLPYLSPLSFPPFSSQWRQKCHLSQRERKKIPRFLPKSSKKGISNVFQKGFCTKAYVGFWIKIFALLYIPHHFSPQNSGMKKTLIFGRRRRDKEK